MAGQNTDHAHVMVLPPPVFLGYLIGALAVNWIVPFPTPRTFVLRIGVPQWPSPAFYWQARQSRK